MIIVEGVARNLDPDINFWEVSKPEIEKWLKDELGIANRLKETQVALRSLARKVPDLPDFLTRAENAFEIIVDRNSKKDSKEKYVLRATFCLLYTSPSPRDVEESRMPSSA